ncbi:sugar transferase [Synechococcus sp. MW101C3]|uniref:sugar transferase n=1 Tax=Synechococcus sp. MW101C3 TaxID=210768 RepID=UPI001E3A83B3|nr:sugar transferase [Synechococcus sp. MW101C3]
MVNASSNPYRPATPPPFLSASATPSTLSHSAALSATSSAITPLPGRRSALTAVPTSRDRPTAAQLIEAQSTTSRVVKRTGDIVFSLAVLGLGSPLFLMLAALVKVSSPGPVFYVQRRIGRGFRDFGCIKFRTMRKDADLMLQALLEQSPELKREYGKDFKLKADPRITPIGRFLRRSSLDELPQFLNVLRGEMSVVGPRPIVRDELRRYGRRMNEVLAVRPGITGLWQVSGRNNLRYAERVRMDVAYARHRSLCADLSIILRTVGVVLFPRDRGAY